jgi:hypothetical protein
LKQAQNTAEGSIVDFTQYFFAQGLQLKLKFCIFLNFCIWLSENGSYALVLTGFHLTLLLFICAIIKIMKYVICVFHVHISSVVHPLYAGLVSVVFC